MIILIVYKCCVYFVVSVQCQYTMDEWFTVQYIDKCYVMWWQDTWQVLGASASAMLALEHSDSTLTARWGAAPQVIIVRHLKSVQWMGMSVYCFEIRYGWGLRVEGWALRVEGWGLRVEGWGLRVDGWGLMVEGWGWRVEGWGLMVEVWWLRFDGWGLRFDGWWLRFDGWGLLLYGLGFTVCGLGCQIYGFILFSDFSVLEKCWLFLVELPVWWSLFINICRPSPTFVFLQL
jgi:hypothetical protein